MATSTPLANMSNTQIETLVSALESLTDGELAVDLLISTGKRAIAPLEAFLLRGKAKSVSIPRCRAARALGGLGARAVLLAYFTQFDSPEDPALLLAEDAVRSTVARELMHWRDEAVFQTLLRESGRRATLGLIETLGEFGRIDAIPVLFEKLEDDLCRTAAFAALLKIPEETARYAILSLRRETRTNLEGPAASRRRRASAELFCTLEIASEEWKDLSRWLDDGDPTVVVNVATAGFRVVPYSECEAIIVALFRVAPKLNWLQEDEVVHLLDDHKELAHRIAMQILRDLRARGEHVNWLSPAWRILGHLDRLNARKL